MTSTIRGADDFDSSGAPALIAVSVAGFGAVSNTPSKVPFDTIISDTASCYDVALRRFTPNRAGLYQVNTIASWLSAAVNTTAVSRVSVYKNGAVYRYTDRTTSANVAVSNHISCLVPMNGTTDYLEVFVLQNSGATISIGGSSLLNEFSAYRVAKG